MGQLVHGGAASYVTSRAVEREVTRIAKQDNEVRRCRLRQRLTTKVLVNIESSFEGKGRMIGDY